jgi:hypothetical protein
MTGDIEAVVKKVVREAKAGDMTAERSTRAVSASWA